MHVRQLLTTFTPAQYLAMEAVSDTRHELVDGQILAMAGGTRLHSAVCAEVLFRLRSALRPPCRVFQSDLRVNVAATGSYFYPDISAVCGTPTGPDDCAIDNPTVLVEVLSPSTSAYDRGDKVLHYQQIPAARDIVLLDPETRRITHWHRAEAGASWQYRDPVEEVLALAGCDARIPVGQLFVDLPAL
jgi:Uma2 family endonuclease